MTRSITPLPRKAPRGHAFAVRRLTHVVGPGLKVVDHTATRWTDLEPAERVRQSIDYRLVPHIVIVDQGA
jgi:hypothetical protein